MKSSFLLILKSVVIAAVLALPVLFSGSAQAQIFCPSTIPGQTGIALQGGTCTNGTTGAFSNATLASQALSDLSQSTTQETTRTANNAINDRRQTEANRCPEGMERVGDVCQRPAAVSTATPAPVTAPASATTSIAPSPNAARPAAERRRAAPVVAAPRTPVYKAPPVPYIENSVRIAAWASVFGDYERRTGTSTSSINCCTNAVAGGLPLPLGLSATSDSRAVGFVGGLDFTIRNVLGQGDGVIAGALLGYAETNLNLTTTSTSTSPNVGSGSSTLHSRLSGPSVGAFATYFNGGFSIDNTFKADFLGLNESFTDNLAFTANTFPGGVGSIPPAFATFSGSGSTNLINYSSFGNINYRFRLSERYWIEPTVGYDYTATQYQSGAALLGLADGYLLRFQGGARFGVESVWNQVRVTTILTGLAYDDVIVNGGVVQNAAFGPATLLLAGEGKVRGQGIFLVNFDFGTGWSSFVLADVRGGEGLFGAGGKAGVRYQW
jgi:hypothetical protein